MRLEIALGYYSTVQAVEMVPSAAFYTLYFSRQDLADLYGVSKLFCADDMRNGGRLESGESVADRRKTRRAKRAIMEERY